MKIIILEDFPKLGHKGEVKNVRDGFARNFLIPRNLVIPATSQNLKQLHLQLAQKAQEKQTELSETQKLAEKLNGFVLTLQTKFTKTGKIYGGISAQKISDELAKNGFNIEKNQILLKEPIKEAGEYSVKIKLAPNVEAKLEIKIVSFK